MDTDCFIYKFAGWLIVMLFTLQPVGQHEQLPDEQVVPTQSEIQLDAQESACLTEAMPLRATFAPRPRNLYSPEPSFNAQAGKHSVLTAYHAQLQPHIFENGFIRRRSALCTYRI